MASEVPGPAVNGFKSLAAMLEEKHLRDGSHNPTVEDAVDEEDLQHASLASRLPKNDAEVVSGPDMPAKSEGPPPVPSAAPKRAPVLDVRSEELFPALGSGPKPKAAAPATWGAKPSTGVVNGLSGGPQLSVQGFATDGPRFMSLPGKHREELRLVPSQMLPRGQLKKPLRDILRDISKRSKANIDMRDGSGGSIIFEGKGSTEAVREALREVAQQVGSKQSVRVPIPASARPHIIGRQGAVVQEIQQRSGARVQVPRADSSPKGGDADDGDTIDVLIEGDAVAAEIARRAIEDIVKERASNMTLRLKSVPPEFFPFIAGAHNANLRQIEERTKAQIHVPRYDTWLNQPPPQQAGPGQIQFVPIPERQISISGERSSIQGARTEIERLASELQQQLTLRQLAINRGQHQFILGDNEDALHDFLAETGCSIILPPSSDDSEFLTITGPPDKIEIGTNRAMDLATSMQMASIDFSRQHPGSAAGAHDHARALTRYLVERQILKELEAMYDSRIVLPSTSEGPITWEVYSRDGKNTIRARSDIMSLVHAHPPARIRNLSLDPYFHPFLRARSQPKLLQDYGVYLLLPEDLDSHEVFLIYEGTPDGQQGISRQRPSPTDVFNFEKVLQNAQNYLLESLGDSNDIVAKTISIPTKYQEKFFKFLLREQQAEGEGHIPVRAIAGNTEGSQCEFSLRGPSALVQELRSKVQAFVSEQEKDDLERGYTTTFDFPQKFTNMLIGKRGENINKLREEFDVDIKVENGKVEVKGPRAKADAAKARIINMGKKFEDETTHVLKIPAHYHRELIGQKGSQVNRLQERYNVRVQFPRATILAPAADDQSAADTSSEVGGSRPARLQQAADEVIVKGPSKGADAARDEILSLLQWVVDHSHTATVSVAQSQISSLIGQRGREMDKLRADTGAQIDVPNGNNGADPSRRVEIKIKGTKKQVEEARQILQQRSSEFDASVTKTLEVDKKYHKALIGAGGSNIRKIVADAGGPTDGSAARMVKFPRPESADSIIKLEGNGDVVNKIIKAIHDFVNEREDQVTVDIDVPPGQHRVLIGRGGETRRELESKFRINLEIPKQGSGRSDVKIRGPASAVEDAKVHIVGLLKDRQGETIQVPRHLHHAISDSGSFFRRLRNDYHVTVDHAGHQVPSKPAVESRDVTNGATSLPLITDEPSDGLQVHSWKIVDSRAEVGNPSQATTIPWVLSGTSENVARAKAALEKAIAAASQQSATGYLILPDPRTYRFVVGQGGSQINAIRQKTGCRINVPKGRAEGEAIEIRGSKENLLEARDMILEAVRAGLNNTL